MPIKMQTASPAQAQSRQPGDADMSELPDRLDLPRPDAGATKADGTRIVNAENFARAESDTYLLRMAAQGAFGQFVHRREPLRAEQQVVIRGNPDVLMSQAVFDLEAGPVIFTLPDPGQRLMSIQVINQDHFTRSQVYAPNVHTVTRESAGTRYIAVAVRTLVNGQDASDIAQAHVLQDALQVEQCATGHLELPAWDQTSLKATRDALLVLAAGLPNTRHMFGTRDEVDPIRHLIGSAYAWAGQAEQHAYYLNITPELNDGTTKHRMTIKDVPVDGYWSVTVYNALGYYERNAQNLYSINSATAKKSGKGSIEIEFGACDGSTPNCIPISAGWNYLVRLYQARPEVLDGRWTFPQAIPVP